MHDVARPLALPARFALFAVMATVLGTGCFASHGLDGTGPPPPPPPTGERCGPTTCAAFEVCCNESCGICAEPGAGCISLFCEDAGPPVDTGVGMLCGGERCAPGQDCCRGEGRPHCGSDDGLCPPPGFCRATDECDPDQYCLFEEGECGGPGTCTPRPTGCARNCPGVCGCDGETYCNECEAAMEGLGVTSPRACDWEPPMGPCDSLSYCECNAQPGCEPLVNIRNGCICPCEDPFNCDGLDCDCDCGGADYVRCAPVGLCEEPIVDCGEGEMLALGPTGCLRCESDP